MDSDIAPPPIDLDPRGIMLRQLRLAISTLPLSIPPATATDLIATFAVDPVTLVRPGQDAWEDVIHDIFDVLVYDEGRSRNALQLSQFIRRGDLGMVGFVNWLEKCLFVLNISANLVESRIERITQAMILLYAFGFNFEIYSKLTFLSSGARTNADLPLVPLDPIAPPAISPRPQGPTAPMGCPGHMAKSRCPNLANLGLVTAAKSSERSPCTNGPVQCPISPCAEFEWKYNLKAHISTVHPTATLSRYKSHYELAKGEEVALRTISTTIKHKSSKKKISFRISTEHSTDTAFRRPVGRASAYPRRQSSADLG
jgi:hypothetical protein